MFPFRLGSNFGRSQAPERSSAGAWGAVILMVSIAVWCFFQFCYPYHFFFQEQNQLFLWSWDYISTYFEKPGGLALLAGDFLTQFYYYLFAGATILSLVLLLTGTLLYIAMRNFNVNRIIAMILSIAMMSFLAVCHFSTSYRLSSTIAVLGWILLLWLISLMKGWKLRAVILCCALLPTWLLFGAPQIRKIQKPDLILEKDFAVDCEYYFGNHDKVIKEVESANQWTDQMLFFYNLVQAQRGELPDHLMKFTPNILGTFYQIGPETPLLIIRNMNELYWALGDMTFTERAAMMTNVFSHNNRNVRMIRRLAECNFVSGDSLATEKYLRILDKTFVYSTWAKQIRQHGKSIYEAKMQHVNHHDTITTTDNAHFLMMQLLDANPDNTVALDYILCSTLLLKDLTNFKRDYDRYCMDRGKPRVKKLYQEALCIWLAGTQAPQEEWEKYIQLPEVFQQFQQYNDQRGNPRFKGTYWYYFDKVKAPEV
ncbi:MAG: hypothetical protein IJQ60_06155 [Prevotella sp.]|nr:hypothetical protein [Prevotella sp.]